MTGVEGFVLKLAVLGFVVITLNVPFGYWRANVPRFSVQWFAAVHLPVLLTILLRFLSGTGLTLVVIPFSVLFFFLGQQLGGMLKRFLAGKVPETGGSGSCLVWDLVRFYRVGERAA